VSGMDDFRFPRAQAESLSGPEPVAWLRKVEPAVHGSFDLTTANRLGVTGNRVLDFSANGNVIGPSPAVANAIHLVDVSRYPDREANILRTALAERLQVPIECLVAGNGSTELIWAIARAYLGPGRCSVSLGPTYGEYRAAAAVAGAEAHELFHPQLKMDPEWIAAVLRAYQPHVVWLCHPNNPTGATFPLDLLPQLLTAHPRALFVVDEAYLTLCESVPTALPLISTGQVLVLRSMTKDAALAGLRIGYAVASPPVTQSLRRALPPWSVSALAQAAALAALADEAHAQSARVAVAAARRHLVHGLGRLDVFPHPSVANFVLARIGEASRVARQLLDHGCAVRDCTSFGLPDAIRIGVRPIPDQDRLLDALEVVLRG
jgi:histidinol-phosphate aminotransferase